MDGYVDLQCQLTFMFSFSNLIFRYRIQVLFEFFVAYF